MCTQFYGFWGELQAKYPKPAARGVYGAFKRVFALLPLACLIEGKTLVVHGGKEHGHCCMRAIPSSLDEGIGGTSACHASHTVLIQDCLYQD